MTDEKPWLITPVADDDLKGLDAWWRERSANKTLV